MKTKNILNKLLLTLLLSITIFGCNSYDQDVIEELVVDREFAPTGITARIRNQVVVELNWTAKENVTKYLLEFSADDPDFNNIFKSVEVSPEELPVQVTLEGETTYSIRLKAVSERGLEDSKWTYGEATTLTEQIMLPQEPGDIKALEATLRWPANSNVTQIVLTPGDITHVITPQEKIDGVATITDLTSETAYAAVLYNNAKVRGTADFTTGIDVGDNTLVTIEDDLFQVIADAAPGDILLLEAGDYTAQTGIITLDKSITIQGLRAYDKPLLKVAFLAVAGATDISLIDLDLEGDGPDLDQNNDVVRYNEAGSFNSLLISGCNIHNYRKSFIAGNVTDAIVQTVTVENCIVTDVYTNGGDFIDFRNSDVLNITVKTSTFNNCAPGRDFFRLDDAGTSTQKGLTCNVLLESCTLYGVSNTADRVMYVRFQANKITVKNNLFAATTAYYSNQSRTDDAPTFVNNNYFNAPGFFDSTQVRYDGSDSYTTLDPGFADASTGNFKISDQTLLDNQVGDPRWLQ
ncbi:DUF5123 domain-containing protein [Lutibacter sp. HS1-25]|uniref:DUF5123 domain-containing protein n=1 Tax=Lutibacter sp. HS1-25 TaxID=2485000 RepID=UPI001F0C3780|nr:DUF5123 domain-containing protein [Lutibacter sp. HS1-25]